MANFVAVPSLLLADDNPGLIKILIEIT